MSEAGGRSRKIPLNPLVHRNFIYLKLEDSGGAENAGQENDGQQHRMNAILYRIIYGLPTYSEKQPYSSVKN